MFKQTIFQQCKFSTGKEVSSLHLSPSMASYSFKNCVFDLPVNIDEISREVDNDYLFEECQFNNAIEVDHGTVDLQDTSNENIPFTIHYRALFKNCSIKENLKVSGFYGFVRFFDNSLENLGKIKLLTLVDCKFNDNLDLEVEVDTLEIKNSTFVGQFSINNSRVNHALIQEVVFHKAVSFCNSTFGCSENVPSGLILNYINFLGFISFKKARFGGQLSLTNNSFKHQPSFLDAKFTKAALKETERETFRLIKYSFDSVGNHIEANQYFAYEMDAYRRDLKNQQGSLNERILLGFNSLISDHGQNYVKAIVWWFGIVGLIGFVLANNTRQWLLLPEATFPDAWISIVDILNMLAQGFLPFKAIYAGNESLATFILLSSLLLAGISWHVLVAIRRHSKR